MTANWAFAPVCGTDYWRVIVTSPETMIFLFFMITDPKTVPGGRVGRVVFGALVAVASVIGMATRATSSGRRLRFWRASSSCAQRGRSSIASCRPRIRPSIAFGLFARRAVLGDPGTARAPRRAAGVMAAVLALLVFPVAVVVAGTPSRGFVAPRHDRAADPDSGSH